MKKYDEIVIILLFEQLLNMYEYTIIQASRNIKIFMKYNLLIHIGHHSVHL